MIAFLAFFLLPCTFGAELKGVTYPDSIVQDGKTLVLNGLGLRLVSFLKVKVYVGALYLETRSGDGGQILKSPGIKKVDMGFLRDVGSGKMNGAWDDDFKENCHAACDRARPALEKFKAMMTDFKKNDHLALVFREGRVEILLNGKPRGQIEDKEFPEILLSVWLGPHPPNDEVKDGMLGKKLPD
jgi:hypothetical protein